MQTLSHLIVVYSLSVVWDASWKNIFITNYKSGLYLMQSVTGISFLHWYAKSGSMSFSLNLDTVHNSLLTVKLRQLDIVVSPLADHRTWVINRDQIIPIHPLGDEWGWKKKGLAWHMNYFLMNFGQVTERCTKSDGYEPIMHKHRCAQNGFLGVSLDGRVLTCKVNFMH